MQNAEESCCSAGFQPAAAMQAGSLCYIHAGGAYVLDISPEGLKVLRPNQSVEGVED
ncbi:MAG: hypothetical protein ABSE73_10935 [Planctomycetota bacterium]